MKKLALYMAGLLVLASACSPTLSKVNLDGVPPKIIMEKGACMGDCPVYNLTVYENGIVSYEGIRNTTRQGLHYQRLDKAAYEQLIADFRKANLWQYDDVYRGNFADEQSQTVTITFRDQGGRKQVLGKSSRPPGVLALEQKLDALVRNSAWSSSEEGQSASAAELIVHLRPGADARNWAGNYRDSKLEVVENYGNGENYWLIRFDPSATTADKLLQRIRRDELVVGAEMRR